MSLNLFGFFVGFGISCFLTGFNFYIYTSIKE